MDMGVTYTYGKTFLHSDRDYSTKILLIDQVAVQFTEGQMLVTSYGIYTCVTVHFSQQSCASLTTICALWRFYYLPLTLLHDIHNPNDEIVHMSLSKAQLLTTGFHSGQKFSQQNCLTGSSSFSNLANKTLPWFIYIQPLELASSSRHPLQCTQIDVHVWRLCVSSPPKASRK